MVFVVNFPFWRGKRHARRTLILLVQLLDARTENSENEQTQQSKSYKRKRQKMSKMWDHFKLKIKDNIMVCVHCKMELVYHNSTTSMLSIVYS